MRTTYRQLVSEATYTCYRYNRNRSPDVTPEQWGRIFPNVELLEQQYREEILGKGSKVDKVKVAEIRLADSTKPDTGCNCLIMELTNEATMLLDSGKNGAVIRIYNLSDFDLELIRSAITNFRLPKEIQS